MDEARIREMINKLMAKREQLIEELRRVEEELRQLMVKLEELRRKKPSRRYGIMPVPPVPIREENKPASQREATLPGMIEAIRAGTAVPETEKEQHIRGAMPAPIIRKQHTTITRTRTTTLPEVIEMLKSIKQLLTRAGAKQ